LFAPGRAPLQASPRTSPGRRSDDQPAFRQFKTAQPPCDRSAGTGSSVGASVAPVGDPTPLNGSTLMYVFGQQEDRQCRESATSPKLSFDQPPSSGPVGMLVFRPGSRFGSDLQSSG
jgi:hypothetical protein